MNLIKGDKLKELFDTKTISLVGNGGSLKNKNYSDLIDIGDIVIRFNYGVINYLDYKEYVGEKFDIFATNSYASGNYKEIINSIKNTNKIILTTRPFKKILKHGLYTNDQFFEAFENIDNDIIEIDESYFLNNKVNDYYNFTSGTITLLFLLNFDCKINVFGMDFLKNGYYYGNNINGGHNGNIEEDMIKKLSKTKENIKIFK